MKMTYAKRVNNAKQLGVWLPTFKIQALSK